MMKTFKKKLQSIPFVYFHIITVFFIISVNSVILSLKTNFIHSISRSLIFPRAFYK